MKIGAVTEPDSGVASRIGRHPVGVLMRQFSPTAGGAEAYAYRLVETLATRAVGKVNFEFHVFAQSFGDPIEGVRFIQLPHNPRLPRWINQWRYSAHTRRATKALALVHSHENTSHGDVQTLHVQTVMSNLFGPQAKRSRWVNALKALTSPRIAFYLCIERLRLANAVIVCASAELKRDTARHFPALADCAVIAPATHAPPLQPRNLTQARLELRQKLASVSLPNSKTTWLLFAANDCEKKGLSVLLDALSTLPTHCQLLVAGKTDQHARFARQINSLELNSRVHFLGTVSNMPALYSACDMLIHPTQQDAFPMVVLESMGNGLPVITTPAPFNGMSAQLQHGREVLMMTTPSDAASLTRQVSAMLASPTIGEQLRVSAHAFARQHSWDSVADRYTEIYETRLKAGLISPNSLANSQKS